MYSNYHPIKQLRCSNDITATQLNIDNKTKER